MGNNKNYFAKFIQQGFKAFCHTNKTQNIEEEFPELEVLDKHPERYKIDAESAFVVWNLIHEAIYEFLLKKRDQTHVPFSDAALNSYAGDIHTWLRESHHVYDFYFNDLDKLVDFVDKQIMNIPWCDEAKQKMKKLFGYE